MKNKNFVTMFLARVLFMPKKFLHIIKNKIKKDHDNWF